MIYQMKNEELQVQVNSLGAELWSIQDKAGKEYLWQGEESTWKNRATNLFPFCGRMTNGIYTYQGKSYEMQIHGFAKSMEFTAVEQKEDCLTLAITENAETLAAYPFHFRYLVRYQLVGKTIRYSYIVENKDEKIMYFAVGGHPGFQVPMEKGLAFEDYEIGFTKKEVEQILLSPEYFMTKKVVVCPAVKESKMRLHHDLFDKDALILQNMGKEVVIQSEKAATKIRVAFPDMTYLAIWHRPHTQAGFVCIEPWSSLPAEQGVVEDLEKKADLIELSAGKVYENHWEIEILF